MNIREERIRNMVELRKEGKTFREIANELNLKFHNVIYCLYSV